MFGKSEIALGLLLLTSFAAVPANAQQSPTEVLIQRARTLDGQGRHDLAAGVWKQVLLVDPVNPTALAGLATYFHSVGDDTTANKYLSQLRNVKPGAELPTAHVQTSSSDFEAAAKMASQHRYQEALALYRKAFHGTEPSGMYAVSYYETEAAVPAELPNAIEGLRALAQKYPANPGYQLALGRVLTYEPKTRLEGIKMLSTLRGSSEQMNQARIAWRQAILFSPGGPGAETAPEYLSRFPDDQLAAKVQSAQAERQAHPVIAGEAEQGAAYATLRKGDLAQAQQQFEALLSIPPQHAKALAGLGYVNMQQKDFGAAVNHFEEAQRSGYQSPELASALLDARYFKAMKAGNTALENDDLEHAMTAYQEAHTIKPAGAEALQGQAGVWMVQNRPDKALPLFEQAVRLQQDRPQAWTAWFDAMVQDGRSKEVIADLPYIAPETRAKLEDDPDFMAVMAAAQMNNGNDAEGRRLLTQLGSVQQADARSAAELRAAQLLGPDNPRASARLAFDVVRVAPEKVEAWKLLSRDEHIAGRDQMALTVVDRMPSEVYQKAAHDVDFLTMLAATHQEMGHYSTASNLLNQARIDARDDVKKSNAIEAQTASLLLAEGNAESAYKTYVKILKRSPSNADAWSGVISSLHQAKQDDAALTQIQQLPVEVAEKLEQDPGFLQILSSVYSATGHNQVAMDMMGKVLAHYQPGTNDAPYAVQAQYAWLLLLGGDENRLSATLAQMGRLPDLTAGQKQQTSNIWAAWAVRKAEKEEKTGNSKQALAILQTASQAYPNNGDIRRATAGTYIRNNEGREAFALYQQIDWARATATDYAGAISAAAAAKQKEAGRQWLLDGLEAFPNDTTLLSAAAQFEEGMGDTRKAEMYWRKVVANSSQIKLTAQLSGTGSAVPATAGSAGEALARMLAPQDTIAVQTSPGYQSEPLQDAITALPIIQHPTTESYTDSSKDSNAVDSSQQASPWLVRKPLAPSPHTQPIAYHPPQSSRYAVQLGDGPPPPAPADENPAAANYTTTAAENYANPAYETSPSYEGSPSFTQASFNVRTQATGTSGRAEFAPEGALGSSAGAMSPASHAVVLQPGQQAQAQLEGLAGRYSSYLGGGTQLGGRSGTPGFDQLTRLEAIFESSAVLGESARFTVRTTPTLLSAGAADGTSNFGFGKSGAALIGADHYQSGVGGELQVSTRAIDANLGFTPYTFYVSHLLGSVAVHPANFPVSFRVYRDQVKETMLSYAGEKDPLTGQIWGGVVATGAEGGLSLGSAAQGFYVTGGASELTGVNLNKNSRMYGSTGAYWTAYSNPYGVLKIGVNITGLHYAQNQRYFTFGQGGYFSPNSYVLLNAPFEWQGKQINHVAYDIKGSLGVQSFNEATALPGSIVSTVTTPTAQANTGSNYNLEANVAYRFDEHWYMGGFVGVNNAHDYQDRSAGFAVKYMQRPQVEVEGGPTGLFDEKAIRPLIVP